jgi:hypothetical protein
MEIWSTNVRARHRVLRAVVHPDEPDGLETNETMVELETSPGYISRTFRRNDIGSDFLVFRPELVQENARWSTSPSLNPLTQLLRHAHENVRPISAGANVPWAFRRKASTVPPGIHELAIDAYMDWLNVNDLELLVGNEMHGCLVADTSWAVVNGMAVTPHHEQMLLRLCYLPHADAPPEGSFLIPRIKGLPNAGTYSLADHLGGDTDFTNLRAYLLQNHSDLDFVSVGGEPTTVWRNVYRTETSEVSMMASEAVSKARLKVSPLVELLLQAVPMMQRRVDADGFTGDPYRDIRLEVGASIGETLERMFSAPMVGSNDLLNADAVNAVCNFWPIYIAKLGGPVAAGVELDDPGLAVSIREEMDGVITNAVHSGGPLMATRPAHRALAHMYVEMYGLEGAMRRRGMDIEEFDPTFETPELSYALFQSHPQTAFGREMSFAG